MRGAIPRICMTVVLAIGLGACAAALEGYPDRVSEVEDELKSLEKFMADKRLSEYALASTSAQRKESLRNEYVFAKMRATDIRLSATDCVHTFASSP